MRLQHSHAKPTKIVGVNHQNALPRQARHLSPPPARPPIMTPRFDTTPRPLHELRPAPWRDLPSLVGRTRRPLGRRVASPHALVPGSPNTPTTAPQIKRGRRAQGEALVVPPPHGQGSLICAQFRPPPTPRLTFVLCLILPPSLQTPKNLRGLAVVPWVGEVRLVMTRGGGKFHYFRCKHFQFIFKLTSSPLFVLPSFFARIPPPLPQTPKNLCGLAVVPGATEARSLVARGGGKVHYFSVQTFSVYF